MFVDQPRSSSERQDANSATEHSKSWFSSLKRSDYQVNELVQLQLQSFTLQQNRSQSSHAVL